MPAAFWLWRMTPISMRCSAGFYPAQATGWTVHFSGTEAQLRLQMEEYDLLLLDLMLPGLAGES